MTDAVKSAAWRAEGDPEPWCETAGTKLDVEGLHFADCPGCGRRLRLSRDGRVPTHAPAPGVAS